MPPEDNPHDDLPDAIAADFAELGVKIVALEDENELLRTTIVKLLGAVGNKGTCKGCGADIWWIKTKRGKPAPYSAAGVSHFSDCPQATMFRR